MGGRRDRDMGGPVRATAAGADRSARVAGVLAVTAEISGQAIAMAAILGELSIEAPAQFKAAVDNAVSAGRPVPGWLVETAERIGKKDGR